jgi:hypothetical protein
MMVSSALYRPTIRQLANHETEMLIERSPRQYHGVF